MHRVGCNPAYANAPPVAHYLGTHKRIWHLNGIGHMTFDPANQRMMVCSTLAHWWSRRTAPAQLSSFFDARRGEGVDKIETDINKLDAVGQMLGWLGMRIVRKPMHCFEVATAFSKATQNALSGTPLGSSIAC